MDIICKTFCFVFRLGIVFVANDEKEITGFDDASVAMLNLYNFIKINDGIQKALDVLIEVKSLLLQTYPKSLLSFFFILIRFPENSHSSSIFFSLFLNHTYISNFSDFPLISLIYLLRLQLFKIVIPLIKNFSGNCFSSKVASE